MNRSELNARLPPGQQWAAPGKWPVIGERSPLDSAEPWRLTVTGTVKKPLQLSAEDLQRLPQTRATMDIHCVTRWSMPDVEFEGVLLKRILDMAGVRDDSRFVSFIARSSRNHSTSLDLRTAEELETLIALKVNGAPIETGHGGPIRNIVRGRYFYKSVKWLTQIELLNRDSPGFWEAESGYHNEADPWKEQRYMAPTIDRRLAAELIESKNFSGHDLRSIRLSDMNLDGLVARDALLRDARFENASLIGADFSGTNLSNSHFESANLRGACFSGADLEGANLAGADLRDADMSGCTLTGASFCEIDSDLNVSAPAIIDATTILDEQLLAPLTPSQLGFVRSRLKT